LFSGGTYFRSIKQSPSRNDISLQIQTGVGGGMTANDFRLTIRFNGSTVETYDILTTPDMMTGGNNGISLLRSATASSNYIEMYPRGKDKKYDKLGIDGIALLPFSTTYLRGGAGGPTDARGLAKINTGQERSIIIISTREQKNGESTSSRAAKRIRQWNGTQWISYRVQKQGRCPV
jgi:hypothetical protein